MIAEAMAVPFNQTKVELKWTGYMLAEAKKLSFNQTKVELKLSLYRPCTCSWDVF